MASGRITEWQKKITPDTEFLPTTLDETVVSSGPLHIDSDVKPQYQKKLEQLYSNQAFSYLCIVICKMFTTMIYRKRRNDTEMWVA
jgi:hypothetical protein